MDTPVENRGRTYGGTDPSAALARREQLLTTERERDLTATERSEVTGLTNDLTQLLDEGSTVLRRLELASDATLLHRLASLEPVHPLTDPMDPSELRRRTEGSRHCYVIENSSLPGHPLNVVWVALVVGLPAGIRDVLATDASGVEDESPTTAVFYSIWNVEGGLAGIPAGSELLNLVTDRLRREFPSISTFTTLSPIPGFRAWLTRTAPTAAAGFDVDGRPPVDDDGGDSDILRACARYLSTVDERGLPIDDVARFHMRNGARLWRLLPGADPSDRGHQRSWGVMANYRYWPEDLDLNRRSLTTGRLAIADSVKNLIDR